MPVQKIYLDIVKYVLFFIVVLFNFIVHCLLIKCLRFFLLFRIFFVI